MYIFFKCEVLNAQDMTFMDDSDVNKSIIIGPAYVQKIEDYSQMKDYFLQKTALIHKMRSKLVKRFGIFFFEEMSEIEWQKKQDQVVVLNDQIKSEKELLEFLTAQQNIYDFEDTVLYKIIIIPEFS